MNNIIANKKCVFILEDNDDLRELFTYMLEMEQYDVKGYPSATTFRAGLVNGHPNIVLMDVMLPDGNGLDICNQMKSSPLTSSIPIIMMSAHKNISQLKSGCNAEDFIEKPFDIDIFLAKVQKFIN